ncbi:hypothetical protein SAMN05446037_104818 [Anaerovirgula multivorans]|uniref:Uncharacterized protein n=1 Tax=Anaerovirgula multivorans TaxID=312168 RepID=A0A239KHZ7_9FIRM|nr:hypothetical protein SAMN05446037_104818 [Anaerovirgula multivorans]
MSIIKIFRILFILVVVISIIVMINYNSTTTDRFLDFLDDIKNWSAEGSIQNIEVINYTQSETEIELITEKEIINEIILLLLSSEYNSNGNIYLKSDDILYQISITRSGYNTEVPISFTIEFIVYNNISYSMDTITMKNLVELFNSQLKF